MRRVPVVLSAVACLLFAAVLASRIAPAADVQEVLIGGSCRSPVTSRASASSTLGGADRRGHRHNDYPTRGALGPGKGFPGLGGATMKLVVRDDQSRGRPRAHTRRAAHSP